MRVTGGLFRNRTLRCPHPLRFRPTKDIVREAIFDSLRPWIPGRRVLDLFAGTGAMGIEALSNGAAEAVFVESDPAAVAAIEANIDALGLGGSAAVVRSAVERAIGSLQGPFDLIIADPPYRDEPAGAAGLLARAAGSLLAPDGRIVLEHSSDAAPPEIEGLEMRRSGRYGKTTVTFYGRAG